MERNMADEIETGLSRELYTTLWFGVSKKTLHGFHVGPSNLQEFKTVNRQMEVFSTCPPKVGGIIAKAILLHTFLWQSKYSEKPRCLLVQFYRALGAEIGERVPCTALKVLGQCPKGSENAVPLFKPIISLVQAL